MTRFVRLALLLVALALGFATVSAPTTSLLAQEAGQVPGGALGGSSDTDLWRAIRRGESGQVSIPNAQAGVLIQSEGESWRAIRNGPLSTYGVWVMAGMIALLALFFLLRGRVRIEHGPSDMTVERFGPIDRFAHWLTAISFIVLALTGLNLLYGKFVLLPAIGPAAFGTVTQWGKYAHNYLAFAFMLGVVLMFVLWIKDNLPSRYDVIWLLKGGGLFAKGVHPPARRFNAGQKLIFWAVILGGLSLSLSGWALLFPFEYEFFSATFAKVNAVFGTELPAALTPIQEMQLNQVWHAAVALVLIAIILAHIYIGSIGMEGAFSAMGNGRVDLNWAREHHALWVEEMERKHGSAEAAATPAE